MSAATARVADAKGPRATAYSWRCVCGDSGTGEAAAQRHAKDCHRFGWPNTNPWVEQQKGKR